MAKIDEYKHPQWQKKRLETLERFRYSCAVCGATESTLHIHHKRYATGKKVWECENRDLIALCEGCHKDVEDLVKFAREHGPELMIAMESFHQTIKPMQLLELLHQGPSCELSGGVSQAVDVAVKAINLAFHRKMSGL